MIGSCLVKELLDTGYDVVGIDRNGDEVRGGNYCHYKVDLADKERLQNIVACNKVDRLIHLAALAHSQNGRKYSWEDYRHLNVECAVNVFEAAGERPVLFISTVDVFGFTKGSVSVDTEPRPISHYAKSKKLAEDECKKLAHYTIFRFSPVYTEKVKRDIQKRYYLRYPDLVYQIGKGTEYEVLNVKKAVKTMAKWCESSPKNDIQIIKDDKPMFTPDYIKAEKEAGRAKLVLRFPKWTVVVGFLILKGITGENKYTYLLNKAVHPLKTREKTEVKH